MRRPRLVLSRAWQGLGRMSQVPGIEPRGRQRGAKKSVPSAKSTVVYQQQKVRCINALRLAPLDYQVVANSGVSDSSGRRVTYLEMADLTHGWHVVEEAWSMPPR